MAGIASLTDRNAVLAAISDYDRLGRDAFLERHRFGRARWWHVVHNGKQYDSKAIVGVAIGIQTGRALTTDDFSGGEGSVVRKLRSLGFTVLRALLDEQTAALPEEVDENYPEGLRTTVTVNRAERSAQARLACIEAFGTACTVCGMEFRDVYGPSFDGLIHVHHLKPLGEATGSREVNPRTDLRPVCPNCHAALHHGGVTRTLEELQDHLQQARRAAV
jgi:5-methylcytosine-specific restriction enzyme A